MLLSITTSKRAVVVSLLHWVTTAFAPLSIQAIGIALQLPCATEQTLEDATKDFVDYAGGLLFVTSSQCSNIVVAIHASLVDFLQEFNVSSTDLPEFPLDAIYCHKILAARLLDYMEHVCRDGTIEISVHDGRYERYPLLKYGLASRLRHLDIVLEHHTELSYPLLDENHICHQDWLNLQYEFARRFKSRGAFSILHVAALGGHGNLMTCFLSRSPNHGDMRDEDRCSPLFFAISQQHRDAVSRLLQGGANPNATISYRKTLLHLTCTERDEEIVAMLLTAGADPNAYVQNPRPDRSSERSTSLLEDDLYDREYSMVRNRGYPDSGTTLHFAAIGSHPSHVRILLKHGVKVNTKGLCGQTALHFAASHRDSLSIDLLLTAGAEILAREKDGMKAFHVAAEGNSEIHVLAQLVNAGHPIDTPTLPAPYSLGGTNTLHIACAHGNVKAVKFLLQRGASTNHRDNLGRIALHWVADANPFWVSYEPFMAQAQHLVKYMDRDMILAVDSKGHTAHDLSVASWNRVERILKSSPPTKSAVEVDCEYWKQGLTPVHEVI